VGSRALKGLRHKAAARRSPARRWATAAVAAAALACIAAIAPFQARVLLSPQRAAVFAGNSLRFSAMTSGLGSAAGLRWTLVGPGSLDQKGLYRAPEVAPSLANVVVSAGSGIADAASVQTVSAPPAGSRLILTSCFDTGTIDVRRAGDLGQLGALTLGAQTGGISIDDVGHTALLAAESRVVALDMRRMRARASAPLRNVRFSQVAALTSGFYAATDNNAEAGAPGVRIFRVNRYGVPVLVSSAGAGETPEGLAAMDGGRTFFVTNINSNSVMMFGLDAFGRARLESTGRTGARPFGVAADPIHHLLFVADNDTATISGARSAPGLEVFALPSLKRAKPMITTGSATSLPLGVALDAKAAHLFVTNEGDGNVAVFSVPSMRRIATLAAGLTPWLPALDERHHFLYVPNARSNTISMYDSKSLKALSTDVPVCAYPTSIAISNVGSS